MADGEKNKKRIILIACLGAGVLLVAALVLVYVFLISPAAQPAGAVLPSPQSSAQPSVSPSPSDAGMEGELLSAVPPPLIYVKDKQVFMASGENTKYLGGYRDMAGCYSLQMSLSEDNRYLYYLTAYDIYKGSGTLMRVPTDALSPVVRVAQSVCSVEISADGKSALYYTDMKGFVGDLYLWREGRSELVAHSVSVSSISPRSRYVSYVVDSGTEQQLYLKKVDSAPVLVKAKASAPAQGQSYINRIAPQTLDDKGTLLYFVANSSYSGTTFLYKFGGDTEELGAMELEAVFGSLDDMMYSIRGSNDSTLYHKVPGMKPVVLSEKFDHAEFAGKAVGENRERFLLAERVSDNYRDPFKLYEQHVNGERTFIADADGDYLVNSRFDCVAYEREEGFYVSTRMGQGWVERFLSKIEYDDQDTGTLVEEFDKSGEHLYYYDYYNNGPMFRFSVKTGEITKIMDKTQANFIFDDAVYAISAKKIAYRVKSDGTAEKVGTGITSIRQTAGGIYLLTDHTDGKIILVADGAGKGKTVAVYDETEYMSHPSLYGYWGNHISDRIEGYEPLGENVDTALEILKSEIYYCLFILKGIDSNHDEPLSVKESEALIDRLLDKPGLDPELIGVLQKMKQGFRLYGIWLESGEDTQKAPAVTALQEADAACHDYEYGPLDEDTGCED